MDNREGDPEMAETWKQNTDVMEEAQKDQAPGGD